MYLKQFFLTPQCLFCGSFFVLENLFCHSCSEKIFIKKHNFSEISEHYFLFNWSKDSPDYMDQCVYRLKSNNSVYAIQALAKKLAVVLTEELNIQNFSGLIPIPSSRYPSQSQNNHAFILAEALSIETGLKVYDILVKNKAQIQQKNLNKKWRAQSNAFSLKPEGHELFTKQQTQECSKKCRYIFVDDILTTGQSYFKCSELVHWSKQNAIATFFYRTSQH